MKIAKRKDRKALPLENCHGGEGTLFCDSLLDNFASEKFTLMHSDLMPAGTSIGVHPHDGEEIYYLSDGKGILTYDGTEYIMDVGDISLCKAGHSHGFKATEDSILIVVG